MTTLIKCIFCGIILLHVWLSIKKKPYWFYQDAHLHSCNQWQIQAGAQQARMHPPPPPTPPSKFWSTMVFFIQFCIRMLQYKANIACESIFFFFFFQGPGSKGLHVSRSGCALSAHNLLRPLYLKILDPPLLQWEIKYNLLHNNW